MAEYTSIEAERVTTRIVPRAKSGIHRIKRANTVKYR
jgi:hypothetical protein